MAHPNKPLTYRLTKKCKKNMFNEIGTTTRILAPDSSKMASTSSRLTSACSKLGGLYPFLNHSFSMTSAIVILYFKP